MQANPVNPANVGNDANQFDRVFISRDARLNMHHTVGERLDPNERLTATEAFERVGMMWSIQRVPAQARFGQHVVESGQYMMFRVPQDGGAPEFLGMSGEDYVPMQNRQLAHWLDEVSEEFPVESAGYLKGKNAAGIIVFSGMQWDIRVAPRKRDELQDRLVVINPYQVGRSLAMMWTSKAFYCTNQMNWVVSNAYRDQLGSGAKNNSRDGVLRLRHDNNVNRTMEYITDKLALAAQNQPMRQEFIQYLANTPLNAGQRMAVAKAAYPDPKTPRLTSTINNALAIAGERADGEARAIVEKGETAYENAAKRAAAAREAVELSIEERGIGGSAYALLQAVGEYEEWRVGQRADNDQIAYDMLEGDRATTINRAMDKIKEFIS